MPWSERNISRITAVLFRQFIFHAAGGAQSLELTFLAEILCTTRASCYSFFPGELTGVTNVG